MPQSITICPSYPIGLCSKATPAVEPLYSLPKLSRDGFPSIHPVCSCQMEQIVSSWDVARPLDLAWKAPRTSRDSINARTEETLRSGTEGTRGHHSGVLLDPEKILPHGDSRDLLFPGRHDLCHHPDRPSGKAPACHDDSMGPIPIEPGPSASTLESAAVAGGTPIGSPCYIIKGRHPFRMRSRKAANTSLSHSSRCEICHLLASTSRLT